MIKISKKLNAQFFIIAVVCTSLILLAILTACNSEFTPDNHISKKKIDIKTDLSKLELIDNSQLSIAIASDYPPFESFKSIQPVGLDVDLSYQICADLGLNVKFNNTEFNNIFNKLSDKQSDLAISGITITDDRMKDFDFSIPYFTDTKCAVVLNDGTINESNIDKVLNENSKTIVYQSGSTAKQYAQMYYGNLKKIEKDTNEQCIKTLKDHEADIFIVEKSYFDNKLSDEYLDAKDFNWKENFGIAINKNCPNLKSAINEVIQARLEDGTIANMINEHFK